jgi:hypothetical protein
MRTSKIQFGGLPPAQPVPKTGVTSAASSPNLLSAIRRNQSPASLTPLLARRQVRPSFGTCAGRLD